ncbi:uncharacterized protein EHS24_003888 [Apiotrichum porosum]|uniref:Uncharacterized protein n=1 Tax=Apiotrichum porosum TaxID=105984 RepID=A0A427XDF9_9TREE|nr:uncharacterized protein EHS24_003888 [Apiotrichum porosum]RSH76951.1 hypothetical protein EHS24_003888 [Apiotrichum porosum]
MPGAPSKRIHLDDQEGSHQVNGSQVAALGRAALDDFARPEDDEADVPTISAVDVETQHLLTTCRGEPGSIMDQLSRRRPTTIVHQQQIAPGQLSSLAEQGLQTGARQLDRVLDGGLGRLASGELTLEATLATDYISEHSVGFAQQIEVRQRAVAELVEYEDLAAHISSCLSHSNPYLLFGSPGACSNYPYWNSAITVFLQRGVQGKPAIMSVKMEVGDPSRPEVPAVYAIFFDDSIFKLHSSIIQNSASVSPQWKHPRPSKLRTLRPLAANSFGTGVAAAIAESDRLHDGIALSTRPSLFDFIEQRRAELTVHDNKETLLPLQLPSPRPGPDKKITAVYYHELADAINQPLYVARLDHCCWPLYELAAQSDLDEPASVFIRGIAAGSVHPDHVPPNTPTIFEVVVTRQSSLATAQASRRSLTGVTSSDTVIIGAPSDDQYRAAYAPMAAITKSLLPKNIPTGLMHMLRGDTTSSIYTIGVLAHPQGFSSAIGINYVHVHRVTPIRSLVTPHVLRIVNPITATRMGIVAIDGVIKEPLVKHSAPNTAFSFPCHLVSGTRGETETTEEKEQSLRSRHQYIIRRLGKPELLILVSNLASENDVVDAIVNMPYSLYGNVDDTKAVLRLVRQDNLSQVKKLEAEGKFEKDKKLKAIASGSKMSKGTRPTGILKFGKDRYGL